MASAITGTSELAGAPTAYSGSNSSLSTAIQTIWSKEILFQACQFCVSSSLQLRRLN